MSNFDKYAKHTNSSSSTGGITSYVGLSPIKVLSINPTREQLVEIIGDDAAGKFNVDYQLRENYNKQTVRPITVWITDSTEKVSPTIINFDLGQDFVITKKGDKNLWFSDGGQSAWKENEETLYSWIEKPVIKSRTGEADWYDFVYKMVKWDKNDDITFFEYLKDVGLDLDTIYDGNFEGLHGFVNYALDQEFSVTGMFEVKVEETETGLKLRQKFLNRSDTIYYNYAGVTANQVKAIKKREQSQIDAGYQLTNNAYFIPELNEDSKLEVETLVEFNKDLHMKHIRSSTDNLDDLLDL